MEEKCRELQRIVDRKQVEFDLQRIAWEKDYDDCAEHLRQVMAVLRDYIAGDPDSDHLSEALSSLHRAGEFQDRQKQLTQ